MKQKASIKHSQWYMPIRMMIFQLPVEERLELSREIQINDWKKGFSQVRKKLSKKMKASKYKKEDIPHLIDEVRKEQLNH
ncbi:hypothetical protein ACFL2K_02765 [Candidatus Margulisiibacteriota bacterium]